MEAAAELRTDKPWFAIGGIDEQRLPEVLDAGARRVVVVRAITSADDPQLRLPAGSKLGLHQRDSRCDLAQLIPARGEPRMQGQRRDLFLGHPAQLGALPVRHGLEQL